MTKEKENKSNYSLPYMLSDSSEHYTFDCPACGNKLEVVNHAYICFYCGWSEHDV